jgi:hypothetical protein
LADTRAGRWQRIGFVAPGGLLGIPPFRGWRVYRQVCSILVDGRSDVRRCILAVVVICAVSALAACDTLDSDWDYYDSGPTNWSPPPGDNRTHEQKLRDEAWWDEYNR